MRTGGSSAGAWASSTTRSPAPGARHEQHRHLRHRPHRRLPPRRRRPRHRRRPDRPPHPPVRRAGRHRGPVAAPQRLDPLGAGTPSRPTDVPRTVPHDCPWPSGLLCLRPSAHGREAHRPGGRARADRGGRRERPRRHQPLPARHRRGGHRQEPARRRGRGSASTTRWCSPATPSTCPPARSRSAWSPTPCATSSRVAGTDVLLPAEREALAPLLPGGWTGAQVERVQLLSAFLDLLERLASDRFVVWVVEDLHWADSATPRPGRARRPDPAGVAC